MGYIAVDHLDPLQRYLPLLRALPLHAPLREGDAKAPECLLDVPRGDVMYPSPQPVVSFRYLR